MHYSNLCSDYSWFTLHCKALAVCGLQSGCHVLVAFFLKFLPCAHFSWSWRPLTAKHKLCILCEHSGSLTRSYAVRSVKTDVSCCWNAPGNVAHFHILIWRQRFAARGKLGKMIFLLMQSQGKSAGVTPGVVVSRTDWYGFALLNGNGRHWLLVVPWSPTVEGYCGTTTLYISSWYYTIRSIRVLCPWVMGTY